MISPTLYGRYAKCIHITHYTAGEGYGETKCPHNSSSEDVLRGL